MMKEELEKRLHDIAELLYEQGFDDGKAKGLNDAWECARQIYDMHYQKISEIFPNSTHDNIFIDNSAQEAIQKIKEYEQQKQDTKERIKVGDEVILKENSSYNNGEKALVIAYDGKAYPYNVMVNNGDTVWVREDSIERKTGRHFSQIAEVLARLRGEE